MREFSPIQNFGRWKIIMGSPILIMGKGPISNWNDRDCLAIQKAHYQIQIQLNPCLTTLFHTFCAFPFPLKRDRDLRRAVMREGDRASRMGQSRCRSFLPFLLVSWNEEGRVKWGKQSHQWNQPILIHLVSRMALTRGREARRRRRRHRPRGRSARLPAWGRARARMSSLPIASV